MAVGYGDTTYTFPSQGWEAGKRSELSTVSPQLPWSQAAAVARNNAVRFHNAETNDQLRSMFFVVVAAFYVLSGLVALVVVVVLRIARRLWSKIIVFTHLAA